MYYFLKYVPCMIAQRMLYMVLFLSINIYADCPKMIRMCTQGAANETRQLGVQNGFVALGGYYLLQGGNGNILSASALIAGTCLATGVGGAIRSLQDPSSSRYSCKNLCIEAAACSVMVGGIIGCLLLAVAADQKGIDQLQLADALPILWHMGLVGGMGFTGIGLKGKHTQTA